MADNDSQLPVRALASEFTTEVANAVGTTINPAEDYAQGSTTSGQNGVLAQGAVTTSAPTYTTGQTSPLSLDAKGNLRVVSDQSGDIVPVLTYFTDAAVASGATVTHSVAGPVSLDKIDSSMSGTLKMTVAIGVTGSEVTLWNSFSSVANPKCTFETKSYIIPAGSSVKVTLKNRDTSALDTYLTFFTH
jgi:hypothetical protein